MVPACSVDSVRDRLTRSFWNDERQRESELELKPGVVYDMMSHMMAVQTIRKYPRVRMMGFLFARPATELTLTEILPNLDYFHQRSGRNVDFFCAGYGAYGHESDGYEDLRLPNGRPVMLQSGGTCWQFSNKGFESFRQEIEALTGRKWRYSGDSDLILANARFDRETDEVVMDFSTAICVDLLEAKNDRAITSVSALFEKIFQFAEGATGDDPTWGFSEKMGARIGRNVLLEAVFALLPSGIREKSRHALHFYVRDLSGDR
jgi:hypothetical protein